MTGLRETFLTQFDERWRSPLVEYAKRISKCDSEILIFMARKAACLFHCFEDLKLAHTAAACTSNLTLEGDLSWVAGRTVELIDDTLISGTTLFRAAERLRHAHAASIRTTVFCVDRENWCRTLADPEPPYLVLDPHDVTSFSAQAVRALGVVPRPYTLDFPLFGGIRIPGAMLDRTLSRTGWYLDDVSTPRQTNSGASAITMLPPPAVLRELDHELGWRVSEASQLSKVRVYSRARVGARHVQYARALPIVALDPLSHEQLATLWRALERNVGEPIANATGYLESPKERLRLLQFVLASRLFRLWLRDVKRAASGSRVTAELDYRQIDMAFPPTARRDVIDALNADIWQPLGGAPRIAVFPRPQRPAAERPSRFKGADLLGIQARLTEPFRALYIERELPARDLVRRMGREAFQLLEYRDLVERLDQGVSLPELRAVLSDLQNEDVIRDLTSSYMDEAIDRGIAVPIIVDDGKVVYRAFRHGEDIMFTEVEARLICLMLAQAARELKVATLPRLVVEKLIVLLIRAGLARGFIDRWTGTLGDRRAAGIRYYLQGAVAQLSPDRRPYHFVPGDALTSLLKGWGYLRERKGAGYEVVKLPDRPPTTAANESDAKAVGAVLGLALRGTTASARDEELTLVASCLTPVDTAAALAAEVHFFERHWPLLSRVLFRPDGSFRDAERVLRKHEIYEAVNNGMWKCRRQMDGLPALALQKWRRRLGETDQAVLAEAILDAALPQPDDSTISAQLEALLNSLGQWLCDTNIALRELRIAFLLLDPTPAASPAGGRPVAQLRGQIAALRTFRNARLASHHTGDLQLSLPLEAKAKQLGQLNETRATLDRLAAKANALLDHADALVTPFGRPRNYYIYKHLLTIHLRGRSAEQRKVFCDVLTAALHAFISSSFPGSQNTDLILLPHSLEMWKADLAVAASGQFAREALSRVIDKCLRARDTRFGLRFRLWVELEPDEHMVRAENTADVAARNLRIRQEWFEQWHSTESASNVVHIMTSRGGDVGEATLMELERHAGRMTRAGGTRLHIEVPYPRVYDVIEVRASDGKDPEATRRPGVDVGIITVVPEEMKAMVTLLNQGGSARKERKDSAIFYLGELPSEAERPHRVVATQQLKQGNRSIVLAYERLIQHYQPAIIVLLGIGGSIHEDARLGDVVIAEQVVWYEQSTLDAQGLRIKGEASELSAELRSLVNDFFANRESPCLLPFDAPKTGEKARALFGPIGSGEKVLRYREADTRRWLLAFNYKTLALETEAGGLAQAFYETGLTLKFKARGYLVIRGISDHADAEKNDRWRAEASRNACFVLRDFLSSVPPFADPLADGDASVRDQSGATSAR